MESRSDKSRKSKAEDRRMMIKKHFVSKQKKRRSPNSDAKTSEGSRDAQSSSFKLLEGEDRPPSRNSSPEPNCPICLEVLINKSFTDSCFHTFCFTCLVEWSKVKAECPLCKKQFKSIVHNVQSDYSFDEYHINSRAGVWAESRFRYSTTVIAPRHFPINRDAYQDAFHSQMESHRMRYAPHSVRLYSSSQNSSRVPSNFRIRVYAQKLWVRPALLERVRTVSPEFYRLNPACTHRLLPWLNRELVAILQDNEAQVTFVLELIMALITTYEITSPEFFNHIEAYLGDKTQHFIHEFYFFAISPHDMETYDRQAMYSNSTSNQDNEVRIVEEAFDRAQPSSLVPRTAASVQGNIRKRRARALKKLKKLVLKKTQGNWESFSVPSAINLSNPGPSTSSSTNTTRAASVQLAACPGTSSSNFRVSTRPESPLHVVSTDEDECLIVKVLKPRAERTPEIVDLSSDDEVLQTVITVSSGSDRNSSPGFSSPTYSPTSPVYSPGSISSIPTYSPGSISSFPSSSPGNYPLPRSHADGSFQSPRYDAESSSDIECVFTSGKNSVRESPLSPVPPEDLESADKPEVSHNSNPAPQESNSHILDLPDPLQNQSDPRICNKSDSAPQEGSSRTPYLLDPNWLFNSNSTPQESNSRTQDLSGAIPESPAPKKLLSAIVRPWAIKAEDITVKTEKRKWNSSSERSSGWSAVSSDMSESDNKNSAKKLKLRSVVAHYSFDSNEKKHETSQRPSHKKHKKKKKKKKHLHKRKRRMISSDSDS